MSVMIHPWHWLVLGMMLIICELFIPSFTIIWFGLGALLVAPILWLVPSMTFSVQIFLWAIFSLLLTFLWFRLIQPKLKDRSHSGQAREAILGEVGQVIRAPFEKERGVVRFTTTLLGNDEWPFICNESVSVGDRVAISDISGNTLIVSRRD